MANMNPYNQQFNSGLFNQDLNQNQQDLLMAALSSNMPVSQDTLPTTSSFDFSGTLDTSLDGSQLQNSFIQNYEFDPSFIDIFGQNNHFDQPEGSPDGDVDPAALEMNGDRNSLDMSLDAQGEQRNSLDHGEKRKSMADDSKEDDDAENKRRDGEDKQSKKPGRKPLTTEPTTKRKAQNRAAQRAFRERKEKHLKDLETQAAEFKKLSESTNHENGLLRAQVERLQLELRQMRRQFSVMNRSPTNQSMNSFQTPASNDAMSNVFKFAMPRFGSQSQSYDSAMFNPSPIMQNQLSPQSTDFLVSRHPSNDGASPLLADTPATSNSMRSNHGSFSQSSPQNMMQSPAYENNIFGSLRNSPHNPNEPYNIFTSPIAAEPMSIEQNGTNSDNQNAQSRVFQFNANSNSNSTSSPASSTSQYGGNGPSSSCGTSPEPTTGANKEPTLDTIDESDKKKEFMEKMSAECGNKNNPVPASKSSPLANSQTPETVTGGPATSTSTNSYALFNTDFDMFSASLPNFNGQADNANGGFFNDPPLFDSPMNWNDLTGSMRTGLTPSVQQPNPFDSFTTSLSAVKEEDMVPARDGKLLGCNKIWAAIQNRKEFKEGNIDIDSLCNELRKKAKCSESGVVVDQHDVDAALKRIPPRTGPM